MRLDDVAGTDEDEPEIAALTQQPDCGRHACAWAAVAAHHIDGNGAVSGQAVPGAKRDRSAVADQS
jgi:hypothetical protein